MREKEREREREREGKRERKREREREIGRRPKGESVDFTPGKIFEEGSTGDDVYFNILAQ